MGAQGKRVAWGIAIVLVAIVVVAAALSIFCRYGASVRAVSYSCVVALLAVAALVDVRTRTVPTWIVVAMLALWVVTVWFVPVGSVPGEIGHAFAPIVGSDATAVVLDGLMGGVAVGLGMLVLSVLVELRSGRASFGGGDIKLLFMVGLFLGLPASLTMLLVACLIAVVLTMVVSLLLPEELARREFEETFLHLTIPFAPAIAIATTLFLVFGPFTLF